MTLLLWNFEEEKERLKSTKMAVLKKTGERKKVQGGPGT